MKEFVSRNLYHEAGAPLDVKQCCVAFQSWLDNRRKHPDRRVNWKIRRRLERIKFSPLAVRRIMSVARKRIAARWKAPDRRADAGMRLEQNRRKVCEFTVVRILANARKAGELTTIQKDALAAQLLRWLTRSYYVDFLRCLGMEAFFFEDHLEPSLPLTLLLALRHDEAHYRKYSLFAFCAFLGFFRPSLNWQESSEDRKLAASLLLIFRGLAEEEDSKRRTSALRKFIALLFDSRQELDKIAELMAPQSGRRSRAIQKEHVPIVQDAWMEFENWPETIASLHKRRIPYKGTSLALAYKKKRGAVIRTLQRVIEELDNDR